MAKYYIGIDISKITLDLALTEKGKLLESFKIPNDEKEIKQLLKTLSIKYKCSNKNTVICAESMGIFSTFLVNACQAKHIPLCLESAYRIKHSLGILRGKGDKADAIRIAKYASAHASTLRFWQQPRDVIIQLKSLTTIRRQLTKVQIALTNKKTQENYYLSSKELTWLSSHTENTVSAIKSDCERVDFKRKEIIKNDPRLKELSKILQSIPHVGPVTAYALIIATNEFLNFSNAKQFACYCGIAPFTYSSGTSIKGRTKSSSISDREIKSILHMAIIGVTQNGDTSLKKYYRRKVGEGKNKMLVLNAVRNKLLHQIFSCVNANSLYKERIFPDPSDIQK